MADADPRLCEGGVDRPPNKSDLSHPSHGQFLKRDVPDPPLQPTSAHGFHIIILIFGGLSPGFVHPAFEKVPDTGKRVVCPTSALEGGHSRYSGGDSTDHLEIPFLGLTVADLRGVRGHGH